MPLAPSCDNQCLQTLQMFPGRQITPGWERPAWGLLTSSSLIALSTIYTISTLRTFKFISAAPTSALNSTLTNPSAWWISPLERLIGISKWTVPTQNSWSTNPRHTCSSHSLLLHKKWQLHSSSCSSKHLGAILDFSLLPSLSLHVQSINKHS